MSSHSFIDRPDRGEKAVLVHTAFGIHRVSNRSEFQELAISAGVDVLTAIEVWRQTPHAKYLIGTGKVAELAELVSACKAELVLVDAALSPAQERNLEKALQCRVLDRTGLILDIFAQRARTFEGKLQVELAQLRHISARLVRGWTHLERQKGGIGLRGPGETQLETDRRLLGQRIKQLTAKLEKVDQQRQLGRRARAQAQVPTISLVGYTNAGKSTVFNMLTSAKVLAVDQLFATLDPTMRRLELPGNCPVVMADTVGFIKGLPHELVLAFKATLQETAEADLLLHIIDVHDPERQSKIDNVNAVLESIGASNIPQISVYNKCDLADLVPRLHYNREGEIDAVYLSALSGQGIELLQKILTTFVQKQYLQGWLYLSVKQQKLRAALYNQASVLEEKIESNGAMCLNVKLSAVVAGRLGIDTSQLFQYAQSDKTYAELAVAHKR